jgi:CHASE3 domain sensor protein
VYPPVRQFEQYELEFARHQQELSRQEEARSRSALATQQRAWLGAGALLVLIAVVASYVVAANTSLIA